MLIRQDSSSSHHHLSPSVLDFTSAEPDFSSLSDYSDLPDDSLMSAQSFHNFPDQFFWVSQTPPYGQENLFPTNPLTAPEIRQQSSEGPSREWYPCADGSFQATATTVSPQPKLRQHRRALSNSTVTSYASTSSPRQYPAGIYDGSTGYLDPSSYGTYHQTHHYPTPSQTPTQDSFADQGSGRQGRLGPNMERVSTAQRAMKNAIASDQNHSNSPISQGGQHYSNEYLATPKTTHGDYGEGQAASSGAPHGEIPLENDYSWAHDDSFYQPLALRQVPNLGRTMSDIYQDELYNPSANISMPAQPQQLGNSQVYSPHGVISRRLQAANDARNSHSPVDPQRDHSPYGSNSPYGSGQHYGPVQGGGVGSAAAQRQLQKAEADAQAYRQHHSQSEDVPQKTISPQEAYLDHFHDPAEGSASATPLFPHDSTSQRFFDAGPNQSGYGPLPDDRRMPSSTFSFHNPSIPVSHQIQPPSGGFKFEPMQSRMSGDSNEEPPADFPAHLVSMETSKSEPEQESSQEMDSERPTGRLADGGTYTCTYQNCTRRFATPAQLQKHKREGHRSTGGSSARGDTGSPNDRSSASPSRDTQAGPHRCDRINPSTGKPCNTIFSRPYDLTRHEDTIHARRGKKQCPHCNEEKTFSRADALTRHMRVVHPTIDFPGKHRRRNVD